MISTIIFDMDGVLVTEHCRNKALKDACHKIASETGEEFNEIWKFIIDSWKKEKDPLQKYNWDLHIQTAQDEFNADLKIDYASLIKLNLEEAMTYEDVLPTLYRLQGDYKLILVTNGFRKYQVPILKHIGLYKFFEQIFTSDSGFIKPDPRILGENCPTGSKVLFIDDRLYQGIYLGNKLEAKTFLLDRKYHKGKLTSEPSTSYLRKKLNIELGEDKVKCPLDRVWPNYVSNTLQDILNRKILGK